MDNSVSLSTEIIKPEQEAQVLPGLIALLQDTVASDASAGFLPPLSTEDARSYWSEVFFYKLL